MDILEKIFGSAAKVKIMRLFLFNSNTAFDLEKVTARAKITPQAARLNIRMLEQSGLIKPKVFLKTEKVKVNGSGKKTKKSAKALKAIAVKKRAKGWILDDGFPYLDALQRFLVQASPLQDQMIARKFNRAGKIKLLIISGVFIQEKESRVDVLIVGDGLRKGVVETIVKDMEAELGKDIAYAMFETRDFQYRLGMYDKLIRDILDYPHKKLTNRLGL